MRDPIGRLRRSEAVPRRRLLAGVLAAFLHRLTQDLTVGIFAPSISIFISLRRAVRINHHS